MSTVGQASKVMTAGPLKNLVRKWVFNMSGYNKLGLYTHDCYYETPDVQEAISRLEPRLFDDRQWRISRALHLDMTHTILPKEEWTTFEENQDRGYYLRDLIKQVEFERKERDLWESK